jgi:hypothetical protein
MRIFIGFFILATSIIAEDYIKATGVYKDKNPQKALSAASTIALANLAKSVTEVLVEENASLSNQSYSSIIQTKLNSAISDYEVHKKSYANGRAEVVLKLSKTTIKKGDKR